MFGVFNEFYQLIIDVDASRAELNFIAAGCSGDSVFTQHDVNGIGFFCGNCFLYFKMDVLFGVGIPFELPSSEDEVKGNSDVWYKENCQQPCKSS